MSLLNLLEEFIMFEKIRKMKNKKGFTLVELIVVLVILAILAALLIPALTGYIDKANNEKIIATTRQIVMAAQTEVSEQYGKEGGVKLEASKKILTEGSTPKQSAVLKLAEVSADGTTLNNGITKVEITVGTDNGHVTKVYVEQSGKKCTYYDTEADAKTAAGTDKTREGNYVIG